MKIKYLPLALILPVLSIGLSGCGQTEDPEVSSVSTDSGTDSKDVPMEESHSFSDFSGNYLFTTGRNGAFTKFTLDGAGSFHGSYHCSDMNSFGADYDGTVYTCDFSGKFGDLKSDGRVYSFVLSSLDIAGTIGEERKSNGIRYITAYPTGISNIVDFRVYPPNTDISSLPEYLKAQLKATHYFEGNKIDSTIIISSSNTESYGFVKTLES